VQFVQPVLRDCVGQLGDACKRRRHVAAAFHVDHRVQRNRAVAVAEVCHDHFGRVPQLRHRQEHRALQHRRTEHHGRLVGSEPRPHQPDPQRLVRGKPLLERARQGLGGGRVRCRTECSQQHERVFVQLLLQQLSRARGMDGADRGRRGEEVTQADPSAG